MTDTQISLSFALALVLLLSDLKQVPLGCAALSKLVSDENLRGKCGSPCPGFPNMVMRMYMRTCLSWGCHKDCWQHSLGFNLPLCRLRILKSESFIYGWLKATIHKIILNNYNHKHIRHWRLKMTLHSSLQGTNAALLLNRRFRKTLSPLDFASWGTPSRFQLWIWEYPRLRNIFVV